MKYSVAAIEVKNVRTPCHHTTQRSRQRPRTASIIGKPPVNMISTNAHAPSSLMGMPKRYWCASMQSRQIEKKIAVEIPMVAMHVATAMHSDDRRI
jgi:hypothetical protein